MNCGYRNQMLSFKLNFKAYKQVLKLLFTAMKFEILYLGLNKQAKKRYGSRRACYFTMYAPFALTLFLGGKCFLHVVVAENVDFSFKIQNTVFLIFSQ